MSYIKNKYFEEINKAPERFEDEEFFHEYGNKINNLNRGTANPNNNDNGNNSGKQRTKLRTSSSR